MDLGRRFRFTYHEKKYKYIYQSIEALDKMVMQFLVINKCQLYEWKLNE